MRLRLFKLLWLWSITFFCPCLIASMIPSTTELNAFLQLYNSSQEKLAGWSSIAYAIENDYDTIAEFLINKGKTSTSTMK